MELIEWLWSIDAPRAFSFWTSLGLAGICWFALSSLSNGYWTTVLGMAISFTGTALWGALRLTGSSDDDGTLLVFAHCVPIGNVIALMGVWQVWSHGK